MTYIYHGKSYNELTEEEFDNLVRDLISKDKQIRELKDELAEERKAKNDLIIEKQSKNGGLFS